MVSVNGEVDTITFGRPYPLVVEAGSALGREIARSA